MVGKCKKTQEHFDQNVWVVFYFGRVRGALWQRWQSLTGDEIYHHDHIGVKGSVFLEDKLLCLAACINRTSTSSFYRIRHKINFMTITRKCAFRKILGTASAYSEASDC